MALTSAWVKGRARFLGGTLNRKSAHGLMSPESQHAIDRLDTDRTLLGAFWF
jgi:hypothetical protein